MPGHPIGWYSFNQNLSRESPQVRGWLAVSHRQLGPLSLLAAVALGALLLPAAAVATLVPGAPGVNALRVWAQPYALQGTIAPPSPRLPLSASDAGTRGHGAGSGPGHGSAAGDAMQTGDAGTSAPAAMSHGAHHGPLVQADRASDTFAAARGAVASAVQGHAAMREVAFTIPPGTAAAQERGESRRLLPDLVTLRMGDTLVIDNQDEAFHSFGWFVVAPRQRYARPFDRPDTLVLFDTGCTGSGVGSYYTVVAAAG